MKFKQSLEAAEQGDAKAQSNLGSLYAYGKGVDPDYKEALKWYTMAAEQGYTDAQAGLGMMYHEGQGVDRDYKEAAKWYRMAAEQGHDGAKKKLVRVDNGL